MGNILNYFGGNVENNEQSAPPIADQAEAGDMKVVVAIDIGTTYSGYAYGLSSDPQQVFINSTWISGTSSLLSSKCPTVALFDPKGKFHSFGYDAEKTFAELELDNEHKDWYYFRRFKMALYNTQSQPEQIILSDDSGHKMKAFHVFAESIKFLKEGFLQTLKERYPVQPEEMVDYVITVPAIWTENGKQFMKMAALEGGIKAERLKIALEAETASVWCQASPEFSSQDRRRLELATQTIGTSYVVVDLGGGTADITCHRKRPDGKLEELHRAFGSDLGGNVVDTAFFNMLEEIFSKEAMDTFRDQNNGDYLELAETFEKEKRRFLDTNDTIQINIPESFKNVIKANKNTISAMVNASPYKDQVILKRDKLKVKGEVVERLLSASIEALQGHLKSLFDQPDLAKVETVLLVGGFSKCNLIKEAMKKRFPNKTFIAPADGDLAVLKGGVLFGHDPGIICSRRARFTYGREAWPKFDPAQHDPRRKEHVRGTEVCKGVFREMVKIGESIPQGKRVTVKSTPISVESEHCYVNVYTSTKQIQSILMMRGVSSLARLFKIYQIQTVKRARNSKSDLSLELQ